MNQIFLPEYPYSYKLLLINLFTDQQQQQQEKEQPQLEQQQNLKELKEKNQFTIDSNTSIKHKDKEENVLFNKLKASILFNHNNKYHIKQTKLFNLNNNNNNINNKVLFEILNLFFFILNSFIMFLFVILYLF